MILTILTVHLNSSKKMQLPLKDGYCLNKTITCIYIGGSTCRTSIYRICYTRGFSRGNSGSSEINCFDNPNCCKEWSEWGKCENGKSVRYMKCPCPLVTAKLNSSYKQMNLYCYHEKLCPFKSGGLGLIGLSAITIAAVLFVLALVSGIIFKLCGCFPSSDDDGLHFRMPSSPTPDNSNNTFTVYPMF